MKKHAIKIEFNSEEDIKAFLKWADEAKRTDCTPGGIRNSLASSAIRRAKVTKGETTKTGSGE